MNCSHFLLLKTVEGLNGERTVNGSIHLLKGKRSAQTIQDMAIFKMGKYSAALKYWPGKQLNNTAEELVQKRLIVQKTDGTASLTLAGRTAISEISGMYTIPAGFQGMPYEWEGTTENFWKTLSLLIQSLSNLKDGKKQFIPVSYERHIQMEVKKLLSKIGTVSEGGALLYYELLQLLQQAEQKDASLFVNRLTSSHTTGKTYEQLSGDFYNDPLYTYIRFRAVLHTLISRLETTAEDFTFMPLLMKDRKRDSHVTNTAAVTSRLLSQGLTTEEIAAERKLQRSTIEDHIIELAIYDPEFNSGDFLSPGDSAWIRKTAGKFGTTRLKPIKDALEEKYTYFQIRLALAEMTKGVPHDSTS